MWVLIGLAGWTVLTVLWMTTPDHWCAPPAHDGAKPICHHAR